MAPPKKYIRGLFCTNVTDEQDVNESSSDEELEDPSVPLQEKDPEPGDFVLVVFARKNSIVHYIVIIKADKDEDGDYEVQFLRRSTRHKMSYAFVEPIQKEINFVDAESILGVLPKPGPQSTKKQQGIIKFNVNFEELYME